MAALRTFAALLALGLVAAPGHAWQEPSADAEAETFAPLAAELGVLAGGGSPDAVGQRLAALGPDAARLLYDALGRSALPLADGELPLGEREHAALLAGAGLLGRAAFAPLWRGAAGGADAPRRRTAIELIGLLGTASDLDEILQAVTPADAHDEPDPEALPLLEEGVARLLARAPETLPALRSPIVRASPVIGGYLVRALGHAPDARVLPFLAGLLGFDDHLALPLLSEVAVVARASLPPFDEHLCETVRAYAGAKDRQLARVAVLALAELEDEEAIPALIDMCAASDPLLSGPAYLALERTTGLSLPHRAERWLAWLHDEQRWSSGEGARVRSALKAREVPQIRDALRTLAVHRLERQRDSKLVAELLEHADPRVRSEACLTLGALACRSSRPALRKMLSDPHPGVVAAARAALPAAHGAPATAKPNGGRHSASGDARSDRENPPQRAL